MTNTKKIWRESNKKKENGKIVFNKNIYRYDVENVVSFIMAFNNAIFSVEWI